MSDFWADDIEYRAAEGAIDDGGPMHGRDAVRAYMEDWVDMFDDVKLEPVELMNAGENRKAAGLQASPLPLSSEKGVSALVPRFCFRDEGGSRPRSGA